MISTKHFFPLLTTVLLFTAPSLGQQGPEVPCVDCPDFNFAPRPESGIWGNPEQSGSGFMFEVQNETLGGFYFLYDEAGDPIWFLIVGTLQEAEDGDAIWVVESELERLEGGACLNCPFQPPMVVEPAGSIRLEFVHRNFGRFSVDGGEVQNIVPLTYGISGKAEFSPLSDYILPDLQGEWVLHWRVPGNPFVLPGTQEVILLRSNSNDSEATVVYNIWVFKADVVIPMGTITCTGSESFGPICEVDLSDAGEFSASIASFGDSRFNAESEGGMVLQGFRLDYD